MNKIKYSTKLTLYMRKRTIRRKPVDHGRLKHWYPNPILTLYATRTVGLQETSCFWPHKSFKQKSSHTRRLGALLKLTNLSSTSRHICQGTPSTEHDSPLKATFTFQQLLVCVAAWIARQNKLYVFTGMNDDQSTRQARVSGNAELLWQEKEGRRISPSLNRWPVRR